MNTRALKIFLLTSLRVEIRFWSLRRLKSHLADPEAQQTLYQPHSAHLLAVTDREGRRQGEIHLREGFTLSLNHTRVISGSEAVCEFGMAPAGWYLQPHSPCQQPHAQPTAQMVGVPSHSLGLSFWRHLG